MKKDWDLLFILVMFCFLFSCGGSDSPSSRGSSGDSTPNGEQGAIAAQLSWDTSSAIVKATIPYPQGADVCAYYLIEFINAIVTDASGQTVATGGWPCQTQGHTGTVANVPAGTVSVTIQGVVAGVIEWSGQATGIQVQNGQTTDAGTILMSYYGTDKTAPEVSSVNPADQKSGVASSSLVSANFSEPISVPTVNSSNFTVRCGSTVVTGTFAFPNSQWAQFTPGSALPALTNCSATITSGVQDLASNPLAAVYSWSFTTAAGPDITPPTTPGVLQATATSYSQINLSWQASTDPDDSVAGYKIYRNGAHLIQVSPTSYSDTGLSPSTQYCYAVSAVDTSNNESPKSTQSCATTQPLPVPSAPTNVSATEITSGATISWDLPSGPVTSYTVYYSTTDPATTASPTKMTGIPSTSTTITNLTNGVAYFFIVRASYSYGGSTVESTASKQVWAIPGVSAGVTWTSRMPNTTETLNGIAWNSYQLVAVGNAVSGTAAIVTSPDGINWTSRTSNSPYNLIGIVWSGSQFVAVGLNAIIVTGTYDGVTWTRQPLLPGGGTLLGIAWSASIPLFVAVGTAGIFTSPDGINWTSRVSGPILDKVVWSGTQFVAVGRSGTILTSPNGINWTSRNGPPNDLYAIAWSGTQFVAVGASGTIVTSPDGTNWTPRTSGTLNNLWSIAWSGTQFVAGGYGGTILASPNGITWTQRSSPATGTLFGITWRITQFVAVGYGATGGIILTSQ